MRCAFAAPPLALFGPQQRRTAAACTALQPGRIVRLGADWTGEAAPADDGWAVVVGFQDRTQVIRSAASFDVASCERYACADQSRSRRIALAPLLRLRRSSPALRFLDGARSRIGCAAGSRQAQQCGE